MRTARFVTLSTIILLSASTAYAGCIPGHYCESSGGGGGSGVWKQIGHAPPPFVGDNGGYDSTAGRGRSLGDICHGPCGRNNDGTNRGRGLD